MKAYWKIVWSSPQPARGDECRAPLSPATAAVFSARGPRRDATTLRTCTRLARTFFEACAIHASIPSSRLICCIDGSYTTVRGVEA